MCVCALLNSLSFIWFFKVEECGKGHSVAMNKMDKRSTNGQQIEPRLKHPRERTKQMEEKQLG